MNAFKYFIPLLIIAPLPAIAVGQETLPRVLILGDIVDQQPASEAAKLLPGKVDVVFANIESREVRSAHSALTNFDTLLGDSNRDVIHFSLGLDNLLDRAPRMKESRVMPIHARGVRTTSRHQCEIKRRELIKRRKTTDVNLIWASTTPIRHSASNIYEVTSEVEYNAIAAKVVVGENVLINDMYNYVKDRIDMKRPAGHGLAPFFFDREPLHPLIVRVIPTTLNQR